MNIATIIKDITNPIEQDILSTAEYFLHQFNPVTDSWNFIKSDKSAVGQTTFLDGRTNFSTDNTFYQLSSGQVLQDNNQKSWNNERSGHYLFHIGFCGSTLLAKCLGALADNIVCYKEPQVLIDFANLKANNHLLYREKHNWHRYLSSAVGQLNKPFASDQFTAIKPSNWVNSLAPDLLNSGMTNKAVFMSMPLSQFVIAVLRGGRERITFVYQLRQHLQSVLPEYQPLCQQVDASDEDIMLQVVKSIILVHQMQHDLFVQSQALMPKSHWLALDYNRLIAEPYSVMKNVLELFNVTADEASILSAITQSFKRHAKASEHAF